ILVSSATKEGKSIALFLDGNELSGVAFEGNTENSFTFHLERNDTNKTVWAALLRRPFMDKGYVESIRNVPVSVGLSKGQAVRSTASLHLVVFKWWGWVVTWAFILVVAVVSFLWLAIRS